jgi:hypothetical protein
MAIEPAKTNNNEKDVDCFFCIKNQSIKQKEKKHKYKFPKEPDGSWVLSCPKIYKGDFSDKFLAKFSGGKVESTAILSPTDEVFLEVGKDIIKNSRTTLREFSSSMITISSAAIATYIALVGLFLSKTVVLEWYQYLVVALPAFFFLSSIVIFVQAFYPRRGVICPANISEVKKRHNEVVSDRQLYVTMGMYSFIVGTSLAISIILMISRARG